MVTTEPEAGILDRTFGNLRRAWAGLSDQTRQMFWKELRADLPDDDLARIRTQMTECLEARGGEISARSRAAELGRSYLSLDDDGRTRFLELMASEFGTDRGRIDSAVEALKNADVEHRYQAELALSEALEPGWRQLLTRFTALPEGVKFLVDLRADLLTYNRHSSSLDPLTVDLKKILESWFDIALLEMRQIDWSSPAALLEKLIAYEAVHEIRSWADLKNRLDADRRCFAFFHPKMPDEPLIFVEVALVSGLAGNIAELLDESDPAFDASKADTAIFYSISNAQQGLGGISFGNFLIKRVVDVLSHELPNLRTFATLSPIPGFAKWLAKPNDEVLLSATERRTLQRAIDADGMPAAEGDETPGVNDVRLIDRCLAAMDQSGVDDSLRPILLRLCGRYIAEEKGRGGRARDPVAHFHLSNGARVERINWLGDTSPKGLRQSHGLMVNYLYKLSDIENNHEQYVSGGPVARARNITD
ncbi:MAG: malonyl-CoA decarboxylase [Candidatus Endolissoclinum sp. TMED26]|jgi:malonyl-CoA decarboxylase|nr:MAG: malonyl-CoA decarboxylase [Candidatus Endolissoclinum sp. TMED26]